jgi:hypothetical protein
MELTWKQERWIHPDKRLARMRLKKLEMIPLGYFDNQRANIHDWDDWQ